MPRAFAWGGTDVAVQDMRRRRRDGIDGAGDEGVPQIMAVRGTTSSTSGRAVELDSPVDRGPRTLARGGELSRAWEARQDCLMAEMQVVWKYGYIKVGYCVGMRRCYVVLMDELRKKNVPGRELDRISADIKNQSPLHVVMRAAPDSRLPT